MTWALSWLAIAVSITWSFLVAARNAVSSAATAAS
jgi:hypothetical protein